MRILYATVEGTHDNAAPTSPLHSHSRRCFGVVTGAGGWALVGEGESKEFPPFSLPATRSQKQHTLSLERERVIIIEFRSPLTMTFCKTTYDVLLLFHYYHHLFIEKWYEACLQRLDIFTSTSGES